MPATAACPPHEAACLQELASREPGYIIISDSTFEQIAHLVEARPLGTVQVRHREEPAAIYELISMR